MWPPSVWLQVKKIDAKLDSHARDVDKWDGGWGGGGGWEGGSWGVKKNPHISPEDSVLQV